VSVRVILGEPASPLRTLRLADLARRPGLDVVAVGTSTGIVRACASRRPDIALIADDLPPDGGVTTVERIAAIAPDVRVVVLTDRPTGLDALAALRAGAGGVLARSIPGDALTRSIIRVAAGDVALPRELERAVVDQLQSLERHSPGLIALTRLSARERQVLALVADGRGNPNIARTLEISDATVKRHVHNNLRKLDVPTRAAAAQLHGSARAVADAPDQCIG
jgi:DNA-binding NarL/FixJ family response regulator